jgi:hypothetical protein
MIRIKARQAAASATAHPASPRVEIAFETDDTTAGAGLLCGNLGSDAEVDAAVDDLKAQLERAREDARLLLKA